MTMMRIRLELARDHDFPEGSRERGYEFAAPLTESGLIDADEWKKNKTACRVWRFWKNEDGEVGHLVRKPNGHWAFHYDVHGDADNDETGYRFSSHKFVPGQYISIREHDDHMRTFRVVSVRELAL